MSLFWLDAKTKNVNKNLNSLFFFSKNHKISQLFTKFTKY